MRFGRLKACVIDATVRSCQLESMAPSESSLPLVQADSGSDTQVVTVTVDDAVDDAVDDTLHRHRDKLTQHRLPREYSGNRDDSHRSAFSVMLAVSRVCSSGRHVDSGTLEDDANGDGMNTGRGAATTLKAWGAAASIDDALIAVTLIQQEIIHIARGLKSDPWSVIIVVFRHLLQQYARIVKTADLVSLTFVEEFVNSVALALFPLDPSNLNQLLVASLFVNGAVNLHCVGETNMLSRLLNIATEILIHALRRCGAPTESHKQDTFVESCQLQEIVECTLDSIATLLSSIDYRLVKKLAHLLAIVTEVVSRFLNDSIYYSVPSILYAAMNALCAACIASGEQQVAKKPIETIIVNSVVALQAFVGASCCKRCDPAEIGSLNIQLNAHTSGLMRCFPQLFQMTGTVTLTLMTTIANIICSLALRHQQSINADPSIGSFIGRFLLTVTTQTNSIVPVAKVFQILSNCLLGPILASISRLVNRLTSRTCSEGDEVETTARLISIQLSHVLNFSDVEGALAIDKNGLPSGCIDFFSAMRLAIRSSAHTVLREYKVVSLAPSGFVVINKLLESLARTAMACDRLQGIKLHTKKVFLMLCDAFEGCYAPSKDALDNSYVDSEYLSTLATAMRYILCIRMDSDCQSHRGHLDSSSSLDCDQSFLAISPEVKDRFIRLFITSSEMTLRLFATHQLGRKCECFGYLLLPLASVLNWSNNHAGQSCATSGGRTPVSQAAVVDVERFDLSVLTLCDIWVSLKCFQVAMANTWHLKPQWHVAYKRIAQSMPSTINISAIATEEGSVVTPMIRNVLDSSDTAFFWDVVKSCGWTPIIDSRYLANAILAAGLCLKDCLLVNITGDVCSAFAYEFENVCESLSCYLSKVRHSVYLFWQTQEVLQLSSATNGSSTEVKIEESFIFLISRSFHRDPHIRMDSFRFITSTLSTFPWLRVKIGCIAAVFECIHLLYSNESGNHNDVLSASSFSVSPSNIMSSVAVGAYTDILSTDLNKIIQQILPREHQVQDRSVIAPGLFKICFEWFQQCYQEHEMTIHIAMAQYVKVKRRHILSASHFGLDLAGDIYIVKGLPCPVAGRSNKMVLVESHVRIENIKREALARHVKTFGIGRPRCHDIASDEIVDMILLAATTPRQIFADPPKIWWMGNLDGDFTTKMVRAIQVTQRIVFLTTRSLDSSNITDQIARNIIDLASLHAHVLKYDAPQKVPIDAIQVTALCCHFVMGFCPMARKLMLSELGMYSSLTIGQQVLGNDTTQSAHPNKEWNISVGGPQQLLLEMSSLFGHSAGCNLVLPVEMCLHNAFYKSSSFPASLCNMNKQKHYPASLVGGHLSLVELAFCAVLVCNLASRRRIIRERAYSLALACLNLVSTENFQVGAYTYKDWGLPVVERLQSVRSRLLHEGNLWDVDYFPISTGCLGGDESFAALKALHPIQYLFGVVKSSIAPFDVNVFYGYHKFVGMDFMQGTRTATSSTSSSVGSFGYISNFKELVATAIDCMLDISIARGSGYDVSRLLVPRLSRISRGKYKSILVTSWLVNPALAMRLSELWSKAAFQDGQKKGIKRIEELLLSNPSALRVCDRNLSSLLALMSSTAVCDSECIDLSIQRELLYIDIQNLPSILGFGANYQLDMCLTVLCIYRGGRYFHDSALAIATINRTLRHYLSAHGPQSLIQTLDHIIEFLKLDNYGVIRDVLVDLALTSYPVCVSVLNRLNLRVQLSRKALHVMSSSNSSVGALSSSCIYHKFLIRSCQIIVDTITRTASPRIFAYVRQQRSFLGGIAKILLDVNGLSKQLGTPALQMLLHNRLVDITIARHICVPTDPMFELKKVSIEATTVDSRSANLLRRFVKRQSSHVSVVLYGEPWITDGISGYLGEFPLRESGNVNIAEREIASNKVPSYPKAKGIGKKQVDGFTSPKKLPISNPKGSVRSQDDLSSQQPIDSLEDDEDGDAAGAIVPNRTFFFKAVMAGDVLAELAVAQFVNLLKVYWPQEVAVAPLQFDCSNAAEEMCAFIKMPGLAFETIGHMSTSFFDDNSTAISASVTAKHRFACNLAAFVVISYLLTLKNLDGGIVLSNGDIAVSGSAISDGTLKGATPKTARFKNSAIVHLVGPKSQWHLTFKEAATRLFLIARGARFELINCAVTSIDLLLLTFHSHAAAEGGGGRAVAMVQFHNRLFPLLSEHEAALKFETYLLKLM